jgi:hypothetical protein
LLSLMLFRLADSLALDLSIALPVAVPFPLPVSGLAVEGARRLVVLAMIPTALPATTAISPRLGLRAEDRRG